MIIRFSIAEYIFLEKQLKVESITSGSKFQKFQATTVVRAMQNRLAMCMAPKKQR